jgi:hypothetical protein
MSVRKIRIDLSPEALKKYAEEEQKRKAQLRKNLKEDTKQYLIKTYPAVKETEKLLKDFQNVKLQKNIKYYITEFLEEIFILNYYSKNQEDIKISDVEYVKHFYHILNLFKNKAPLFNEIFDEVLNTENGKYSIHIHRFIKNMFFSLNIIIEGLNAKKYFNEYNEKFKSLKGKYKNFLKKRDEINKEVVALLSDRWVDREAYQKYCLISETMYKSTNDYADIFKYIEDRAHHNPFLNLKFSQKINDIEAIPIVVAKVSFDFFMETLKTPSYEKIADITNSLLESYEAQLNKKIREPHNADSIKDLLKKYKASRKGVYF